MNQLATIDRPANDAAAWASQINAQWRKTLEGVIATGRILLEAKASLPHGEFTAMLERDLDFEPRTAQRLMAIAQDVRLSNPVNADKLPTAWTTLFALTGFSDEKFDQALASGAIHPDMGRDDVDRIRVVVPGERENEQPSAPSAPAAHMAGRVTAAGDLDFSPTPPWATRALIERILARLEYTIGPIDFQTAWEPACGEGHMAEVLREYFRSVFASDIHEGYGYADHIGDFLDLKGGLDPAPDWIITNPPFEDRVLKFMKRALELAKVGVAMFVQLRHLEGIARYEEVYRDNPPTIIAFFVERVPLQMGSWDPDGSTTTAYAWLVWIKGMKPQPPFWIPPGCRVELTKPDDAERFTQHPVQRRVG